MCPLAVPSPIGWERVRVRADWGLRETKRLASQAVWIFNDRRFSRRCGEMADAQDLKSWDLKKSCRFESGHRHQTSLEAQRDRSLSAIACNATADRIY